MRKFKCVSLVEKERFGWRNYFDLGGEYELVSECPDLELRSDKGHKRTWFVDRNCFEEVFEKVKPVRRFRIKEGAEIYSTEHRQGGVYELGSINDDDYVSLLDSQGYFWGYYPDEVEEVFEEDNLYVNDLTADVITFLNDNFEMFVLYCGGCETRASLAIDFIERKLEGKGKV